MLNVSNMLNPQSRSHEPCCNAALNYANEECVSVAQ